ncbi:hypothetical protein EK904_010462 [Melospiza melodia maxima]|nr:hypothetical protein EK904_010462 [Melospiza melodia maxima]
MQTKTKIPSKISSGKEEKCCNPPGLSLSLSTVTSSSPSELITSPKVFPLAFSLAQCKKCGQTLDNSSIISLLSFQVVKDTIFPSQVYLRELNTFREKLEKLESEFSKLQGALQAAPVKKDGPMHITLRDLLNVKLKKTNSNLRMDEVNWREQSPVKPRRALITVTDLQSVNLRPKSKPSPHAAKSLITSPKNQIDLRKHLKKVDIERSPGGTPLNSKENTECGSGLTPIMTRALRRKFQAKEQNVRMAHPKSPSPARLSAANSFDEKACGYKCQRTLYCVSLLADRD